MSVDHLAELDSSSMVDVNRLTLVELHHIYKIRGHVVLTLASAEICSRDDT